MATPNISVVFQAFTDKFEQKTQKAGQSIKSFGTKVLAIGASFLAARGIVNKFSESMENLRKIGIASDELDVSPDFLRGMELAAESVGESFDKAKDVIREFNIRMGEAKTGAGPAVNGLKLLGLTIEEFNNLSPEEGFLKVADALSKIEDKQTKVFTAGELFGGAGEDMLALLDQGEEGLKEFIKLARQLGGPISKEDLKQLRSANDSILRMGKAFDGIIMQLTIEFAPLLGKMAGMMEKLVGLAKKFGKAWKDVQGNIEDAMLKIMAQEEKEQLLKNAIRDGMDKDDLLAAFKEIDDRLKDALGIELGVDSFKKGGDDDDKPEIAASSVKSFSDAVQAQSSKAFDLLNPNRTGTVASENKEANKQTANNTAELVSFLEGNEGFIPIGIE